MTIDIEEGERLLAGATLGPWTAETGDGVAKYPTACRVLIYSEKDCEYHPVADFSCNHSCRMAFESEVNAALLVWSRNNLPALIAQHKKMVEALGKIARVGDGFGPHDPPARYAGTTGEGHAACRQIARKALAGDA